MWSAFALPEDDVKDGDDRWEIETKGNDRWWKLAFEYAKGNWSVSLGICIYMWINDHDMAFHYLRYGHLPRKWPYFPHHELNKKRMIDQYMRYCTYKSSYHWPPVKFNGLIVSDMLRYSLNTCLEKKLFILLRMYMPTFIYPHGMFVCTVMLARPMRPCTCYSTLYPPSAFCNNREMCNPPISLTPHS